MPGAGRVSGASPARSARYVAQLPPGYRTAFVLYDVEGHDHEEIARMLGVAVGTSKSQLHKARTKLRGLLRQHNSPEPEPELYQGVGE